MELEERLKNQRALIGIIGLGYVGLPLVLRFGEVGFKILGFDADEKKVALLKRGESYIKHIPATRQAALRQKGREGKMFEATTDMSRLNEPDVFIICVPTPVNGNREPDLQYVVKTTQLIPSTLRIGQLISLESTTYPGTNEKIMLPVLNRQHQGGKDFLGLFSRERGPW